MDQVNYATYLPWVGTAAAVAYAVFVTLKGHGICGGAKAAADKEIVNRRGVQRECPKVVHSFDMEDLEPGKTVYCRCWRSKKFPYCDGSHIKHNDDTGDNVGPLIIQRKGA